MVSFSVVSLLSALLSILAILLVVSIFRKVYQEDYKKPWLFIGVSAIFLASSELLRFLSSSYYIYIINQSISEAIQLILVFISIAFLTYALLLEYLILEFYKGKFVKMKFLPVQEGTLGGEIDLNISNGNSYLSYKKEKKFLIEQFSEATKKGFEGFLLTEMNPSEIRTKYNLAKTPIGWITQVESTVNSDYLKKSLDENSDIIDPVQLNNMISYIDNFLEQSTNSFIMIDLNLVFRVNNFSIALEFLKYISSKSQKYNGILILLINEDIISKSQKSSLDSFLKELE
jgi:hypothetical protein